MWYINLAKWSAQPNCVADYVEKGRGLGLGGGEGGCVLLAGRPHDYSAVWHDGALGTCAYQMQVLKTGEWVFDGYDGPAWIAVRVPQSGHNAIEAAHVVFGKITERAPGASEVLCAQPVGLRQGLTHGAVCNVIELAGCDTKIVGLPRGNPKSQKKVHIRDEVLPIKKPKNCKKDVYIRDKKALFPEKYTGLV